MIERFEIWLNNKKKKIDRKVVGVIIFFVFGVVLLFGMDMTNNFKRQKQKVEDEHNRSMYEMIGYVKNVEVELAKVMVTSTPDLTARTLADIWRQSNMARNNLSNLPVEQHSMENTSKFLAQVSDYSFMLMKKTISNITITDDEYSNIKVLYIDASSLTDILEKIYDDLNQGRLNWNELEKRGNEELPNAVEDVAATNVANISKALEEYEGLIYDGAFSDHLLSQEPKNLGNEECTQEQAAKKIEDAWGKDNIEYINYTSESSGRVELYSYQMKLKDFENIYNIDITKKGCKIYLVVSDKNVTTSNVSVDEAKKAGIEFLKKIGIEDIKDTYYLMNDNMATINYAAVQDGVILYPDLVKVKVSLDNCQILSLETQGYIFNHTKRDDAIPTISIEEAKSILNKNIVVSSQGMAIIPTESKEEVLTYEFKGTIDERNFLIYINAKTGKEEKVFLIIETPGGILTM